ncbi:Hypothetical protein SMAX5B_012286, partial [Scophthalmus maximus]
MESSLSSVSSDTSRPSVLLLTVLLLCSSSSLSVKDVSSVRRTSVPQEESLYRHRDQRCVQVLLVL